MKESVSDLNQRIAARIWHLRSTNGLSLDDLATRSGVSRSMISLIERGESSPTAVVLGRLAAGLDVSLASLFEESAAEQPAPSPVARRKDQPVWQDPGSGYRRRIVSPPGVPQPMQIVEVVFPPGQRVVFESGAPPARIYQQIWVLEGTIEISVGEECYRLRGGDCLAVGSATMFYNPTRKTSRYAVVVASEPPSRKR